MTYDLLAEPWIPVIWADGKTNRVGIKEALTQAGRIRQIAATNPMDRVAIIRFLLALLYWCKGNPSIQPETNLSEPFPEHWFSKLDQNRDCFDLLGKGKRFYQYRKDGDKPLAANYLIHEIPTGTNAWHFRHSTDELDGLCTACCAMGLLRLPLFATSGGRGKPPGINQKPPVYIMPVGENLAATLRLSWQRAANLGTPAWEQPSLQLPLKGDVPLLTGLTWLPRRVWLDNPGVGATCISCGRKERVVTSSVFGAIGSTKTDDGSSGRVWRDPHVSYEPDGAGKVTSLHAGNAIGAPDSGAGQWAGIIAAILGGWRMPHALSQVLSDASVYRHEIDLWVVGFSSVHNDKYVEATERTLPISGPALQTDLAIGWLKRWQEESSRLRGRIRQPNEKKSSRKHVEILPLLAAVRPHVEGKVSAKVSDLLVGGDAAWEDAACEYRPMMDAMARSLSPGFTTVAVQRRKQIANMLPQMGQTPPDAKKPAKGKRGAK